MFSVADWTIVDTVPDNFDAVVRSWDKAATAGGGDYTVGVLLGRVGDRFHVLDVQRGQWSAAVVERRIDACAAEDDAKFGSRCRIILEQEPGSSGKAIAEMTRRRLRGYHVTFEPATGSKEVRAQPWAIAVENREVSLLRAAWNRALIDEHALFPMGRHDDIVDACSAAYRALAKPRRQFICGGSVQGASQAKTQEPETSSSPYRLCSNGCGQFCGVGRTICCDACDGFGARHTVACYQFSRGVHVSTPDPEGDAKAKIVAHNGIPTFGRFGGRRRFV